MVECWKADEKRWVMVDSQLDGLQRRALTEDDAALLDRAAALSRSDNAQFERVRALYEGDERRR